MMRFFFLFVIVRYFLLRHNYVIYLFDIVTFFNDVIIALYFSAFELRMEVMFQLHFVFFHYLTYFLLSPI